MVEFIPYEIALALKELGFDEPCFAYYNGYKELDHLMPERVVVGRNYNGDTITSAPLYQQAFRWFREKYKLDSYHIEPTKDSHGDRCYGVMGLRTAIFNGRFDSYEEAELECLKKLIEIVKQQNK